MVTAMKLTRRSAGEYRAYLEGFNVGIELAAKRMETANDETSRICIVEAIRAMKQSPSPDTPHTRAPE